MGSEVADDEAVADRLWRDGWKATVVLAWLKNKITKRRAEHGLVAPDVAGDCLPGAKYFTRTSVQTETSHA